MGDDVNAVLLRRLQVQREAFDDLQRERAAAVAESQRLQRLVARLGDILVDHSPMDHKCRRLELARKLLETDG